MDHTLGCSLLTQLISNTSHKTRSLGDAPRAPALWQGPSESQRWAEESSSGNNGPRWSCPTLSFKTPIPEPWKGRRVQGPPSSPQKCHLPYEWHLSCLYEPTSLRFPLNRNSLKADPPQGLLILPNTFSLPRFSAFPFLSHTPRPLIIPWTCQPPHQREIGCPVEQEAW